MNVTVRLPASLRPLAGGGATHAVDLGDGATVADLLDRLAVDQPGLHRRLRDEQGELRTHVNLFVAADNIRDLDGPATALADGAEVTVLPAVSGGN
jgi:molybdopterin synthase sulfur carrier subunit